MRLYIADRLAGYSDESGWRIAMLVACSVEPTLSGLDSWSPEGKIAFDRFGERTGLTVPVLRQEYAAWEAAANAGVVPHAADLRPDDVDTTSLPTARWRDYYQPVGMMIEIIDREH